ncbi:MAG: AAA family ATPase [Telmatospirillum sp.]|nr:AAA family ATPase [Telmatospirillum sp.]
MSRRPAVREALVAAFGRAEGGGHELLLLTGPSGIGKTSLACELRQPVTAGAGLFLAGKFEPLRRNIPYAPLIQCLNDLARQGIATSVQAADSTRSDPGDSVLAEVMPELNRLLSADARLPDADPAAAENRFTYLFRRMIGALARAGRPVVLFLDDLQWADLSSLKLIEALAADPGLRFLLMVGAYRDNEIDDVHPLNATLAALHRKSAVVTRIPLGPLDPGAGAQLLADALRLPMAETLPLATRLLEETGGNPMFFRQYVETLDRLRLLSFDHVEGRWQWNLADIARQKIATSLAEVTLARLRELPSDALAVLETAACAGSVFTTSILADTLELAADDLRQRLHLLRQAGLIVPGATDQRLEGGSGGERSVIHRFAHDHIEQALYSAMAPEEKRRRHLAIGRTLQRREDAPLFDLVFQLNRALPLLSPSERSELSRLNLKAARAARAAVAIGPARNYLEAGLQALPDHSWETQYDLCLDLHIEGAELAVWAQDGESVRRHVDAISGAARDRLDLVKALEILIQYHIVQQRPAQALATGREALELLGIPLPATLTRTRVLKELLLARIATSFLDEDGLTKTPLTTDPWRRAVGRILFLCAAPAYFTNQDLFAAVICRSVRLAARAGRDPWTAASHAYYGIILASRLGHYREAAVFGRAALRKPEDMQETPQTPFMVKAFIEPWHRSTRRTWPELIEIHHLLMRRGDFFFAHLALTQVVVQKLFLGLPLAPLAAEVAVFARSAEKTNQPAPAGFLRILQQTIATLRDGPPGQPRFRGPYLDYAADLPRFLDMGNIRAVWMTHAFLAHLNLLFGHPDDALRHVEMARTLQVTTLGQVSDLRHAAIGCIADCANWEHLGTSAQGVARRRARQVAARLKGAADSGETAFHALAALLSAERARAEGRMERARRFYDVAMEAARSESLPHDEGLVAERAADLALELGHRARAEALLHQAHRAFIAWGALSKAAHVADRLNSSFRTGNPVSGPGKDLLPAAATGDSASIDVATLARASRALAENVRLADLLESLMRLVLANGGATSGCLLLEAAGGWRVEASASAEGNVCDVLQSVPPDRFLSPRGQNLIEQVESRLEPIVIEDAANDVPAISPAGEPRSMLGLPLRNRNRLTGILYLENSLVPGVFSRERVKLLDLLSTQIAISVENARLYEDLAELNDGLEHQVAVAEEKSRLLETTLANMSDGILAFDSNGALIVHNPQAFRSLGLPPDFPPTSLHVDTLRQLFGHSATDVERPLEIAYSDGRVVQLRRTAMAGGGEVCVCLDLSDERRIQAELREARAQADMARFEAERANDAKTVFLASVGHDLRQPSQALQLLTNVLSIRLGPGSPVADVVARMESALSTLQRILDGLLDISRLEAGIVTVTASDFSLFPLVSEWAEMVRPRAEEKGLTLRVASSDLSVHADPGLVYRIVANLLDNAIKYSEKGTIAISCSAREGKIRIEVRDDGPGIPPDRQQAIFEDFVQLSNVERNHAKGLGLGLAIAKKLARLMGGDVGVISSPGQGSVFWIDLPPAADIAPQLAQTTRT